MIAGYSNCCWRIPTRSRRPLRNSAPGKRVLAAKVQRIALVVVEKEYPGGGTGQGRSNRRRCSRAKRQLIRIGEIDLGAIARRASGASAPNR